MSETRSVRADNFARKDDQPARGRYLLDLGVLEKFGHGHVRADKKDEIRSSLVRSLEAKVLEGGSEKCGSRRGSREVLDRLKFLRVSSTAVEEEVEKFLENGHISGSNLSRLERRVFRQVHKPGTPSTSRGQRPTISEFSVASRSGGTRAPRSIEEAAEKTASNSGTQTPVSSRGFATSGLQAIDEAPPLWSEMSDYARVLEEKDRAEHRHKIKSMQEKMRFDLKQQVQERDRQKTVAVEEDKIISARQTEELKAWQNAESAAAVARKKIALQVRKDRESQIAVVHAMKQDERRKRLAEDEAVLARAAIQVQQEKKAASEKKNLQRDTCMKLKEDWADDRKNREGDRQKKAAEEQEKVNEYLKMVDAQEARHRNNIPVARMPLGEYCPPNKAERRKREREQDDLMATQERFANAKAAVVEVQKHEQKHKDRQSNQEFLCQQISERENARKVRLDELQRQKDASLAETQEFMESEKQRIEQQRMKNIQHRLELEKQIKMKKSSKRFQRRHNGDLMSAEEVSMNRHLLEEARAIMRDRVVNPESDGS